MHEITEARPSALSHLILPTARFPEVCDWAQLCIDRSTTKPPAVEVCHGLEYQNYCCMNYEYDIVYLNIKS